MTANGVSTKSCNSSFVETKKPDGRLAPVWFLLFGTALALVASCKYLNDVGSAGDRVLAQIYGKTLRLSDLEGMLPEGITGEDSTVIINTYVNYWLREMALLHEAERNIPKDLKVEKLVADYRSSLIKNNYEDLVVTRLLDSTVTQVQLQEFYEANKEQYQLETPIVRCRFVKAPRSAPGLDKAQSWWNSSKATDFAELTRWCTQFASVHHLLDSVWYKVDDIAAYMPKGTLTVDNVQNRRDFIQRDDDFVYFFKLLEVVKKKEIAPLSYIEEQARKVILHKRKSALLDDLRNKLYEEALRNHHVTLPE